MWPRGALIVATAFAALVPALAVSGTAVGNPAHAPAGSMRAGVDVPTAAGGLELTVRAEDSRNPAVVLTNRDTQPCQVVAEAIGSIAVTRAEQDGKPITPLATMPSFDDDLYNHLAARLVTLKPGESVTLALPVVTVGAKGQALRSLTWSPELAIGALHPIDTAKPLDLSVNYSAPIPVRVGPALCPAAAGASATTSADGGGGWWIWALIGGAIVVVGAVLVVFLLRRRRIGAAGAVAVLLAVTVLGVDWFPPPAAASITPSDSDIAGALGGCLTAFRAPGGDPADIMSTLDDPKISVTVNKPKRGGNGADRILNDPTLHVVFWNPEDTSAFPAGGVNREPCDELYHELYHVKDGTTVEGPDLHECETASGGYTGISIKEVNATKAENKLRHAKGEPERTYYGELPLPAEECKKPKDDAPVCHPEKGCPPHEPPGGQGAGGQGAGPAAGGNPGGGPGEGDTGNENSSGNSSGGSGRALSSGDPHVRTFDEQRYEFQAVGEFVASQDAGANGTGAFQIQVRQQPVKNVPYLSINSVVVADVAGDKVQIGNTGGYPTLMINGAPKPVENGKLAHGGEIVSIPSRRMVTLLWPDTSAASVYSLGSAALQLSVDPAAARKGRLIGLFGDFDGNPANDVRAKGGAPVAEPTFDDLYPALADSWRVDASTSLFTYAPGTNTETFTDRTQPHRPPADTDTAQRSWAQTACLGIGVTHPDVLAGCVVDLVGTGRAEFASAARDAQTLVGGFRRDGAGATLAVRAPGTTASINFTGTAGDKLFVEVVSSTLPDACGQILVTGPGGKEIGSGCVQGGKGGVDTVTLPATGAYTVTVDPAGNATGLTTLRLVSAKDDQSALRPGGPEVIAKVADSGGSARLSFSASAGQKVFIEAVSSSVPDQCGALLLTDAAGVTVASGCLVDKKGFIDGTELATAGTYTVVLDPAGTATGEVHLRLIDVHDQKGTIAVGGPAVTATIGQPGAVASFTFTGTAGQKVSVVATGSTLPDQCGVIQLRDAAKAVLESGCLITNKGGIATATLPASAVYTVSVDPAALATGAISLAVTAL